MRRRMRAWAGDPTVAEAGVAVGVVVLFIGVVAAVQVSRGAATLNALQLLRVMVAAALLVALVLKALTASKILRRRSSRSSRSSGKS